MDKVRWIVYCLLFFIGQQAGAQEALESRWHTPPEESRSWVFWYWMQGAISEAGITADLEAMKEAGIAGAHLTPIKNVPEKPFIEPVVEQLSPLWWQMVGHALREADRLGLKIAFHICDGFALAGGPWITPELSMQKVVWAETSFSGGKQVELRLPQPEAYEGYYHDIAVFAYPSLPGEGVSTRTQKPRVTVSVPDEDVSFLVDDVGKGSFRSETPCWIQYSFEEAFTCRSIQIEGAGNNIQSQRFTIEVSDDGQHFRRHAKLEPPRQGWQNGDAPMTHSIPEVTARYFRFAHDVAGTEPGSEDLDAAKWKQVLKVKRIHLFSAPRIHQYEGKNGETWRVSPRTTEAQVSEGLSVRKDQLINITAHVDASGRLRWKAPAGQWTILRMGHTSTGHTNATGGKGAGLECDKFNPEAILLQFNSWFGEAIRLAGPELRGNALSAMYIDSWECGSQNWSTVFPEEFKKRRGYDLLPYLPVMAGVPLESADVSERILYDLRQTIAELVVDKFYKVLQDELHRYGCAFHAECVSPTMLSDGMMHHKYVDVPMGEFWLQSPTHDKPNDMLDAISGARIYGKNIVQAEAFTQLRAMFDEHPGMLKTMQDRNYAMGINRMAYHVYVQNPWLDRKPGMTLDGIGLYFQRDQTWWKPGKAWVDYAQRCQALLQVGRPVVDLAVFTGEELPRRAILPDRLVPFLPGIFGPERVEQERIRLANVGQPTRQMPVGVTHSANLALPEDWVNALRGYQYDSFNPDVLLGAKVVGKQVVFPSGAAYDILVIPGKHPMQPNPECMSMEVLGQLFRLVNEGATVLVDEIPLHTPGFAAYPEEEARLKELIGDPALYKTGKQRVFPLGKGRLVLLPYTDESFEALGIQQDFIAYDESGQYAPSVGYTHRREQDTDIYFVSNQYESPRHLQLSFRVQGKLPELWNPVSGEIRKASQWECREGRTSLSLELDAAESVFVVFREASELKAESRGSNRPVLKTVQVIQSPWSVAFDPESRGKSGPVAFPVLTDWSQDADEAVRHYSGTAVYRNRFKMKKSKNQEQRTFLEIDEVYNLAEVKLNGIPCGVIWTKPYRVEIGHALKAGENLLEIAVTNTWANRIMGDEDFAPDAYPAEQKIWTNARYRLKEKVLVKSGLVGNVRVSVQQ